MVVPTALIQDRTVLGPYGESIAHGYERRGFNWMLVISASIFIGLGLVMNSHSGCSYRSGN